MLEEYAQRNRVRIQEHKPAVLRQHWAVISQRWGWMSSVRGSKRAQQGDCCDKGGSRHRIQWRPRRQRGRALWSNIEESNERHPEGGPCGNATGKTDGDLAVGIHCHL